jgi:hypothetical protein
MLQYVRFCDNVFGIITMFIILVMYVRSAECLESQKGVSARTSFSHFGHLYHIP